MSPNAKRALQIGAIILIAAGILAYREVQSQANIGAGYIAHQMCSCVLVARRSYESCRPDMLPVMDRIQSEVIERDGLEGVRGWVPLLVDRIALHTPGLGCSLD
jgi:hypothetical protein